MRGRFAAKAGKIAHAFRRLDAVPAEAGVAFDEERHVAAVAHAGLGQAAHDDLVVGDDRQTPHARR
jgi:hypothetical protein